MATDVLLDPEGRAVAAGHASAGAVYQFALARFDGAGALDRGFGGGLVLTSFPGVTMARATALARQADGKLVVAGIACASGHGMQCDGGTARLALARYEVASGSPAGPPGRGALPSGPADRARGFVSLPSKLTARRGKVRVRVRCVQAKRCRGTLTLRRLRTGQALAAAGLEARVAPGAPHPHDRRRGAAHAARRRSASCRCGCSSPAATPPGHRGEIVKRVTLRRR